MSNTADFCGRKIEVKVLTVGQVRELLDEVKSDSADSQARGVFDLHVFDLLFDDDVPARAVSKATGLSMEELAGNFPPEVGRALLDKVRAQNPFFVGMMERLVSAGRGASQRDQQQSSKQ